MPHFDDRTVTLDAPEQLAELGAALAARTRLAVLGVLVRADKPLHINEIARRVGVDASPVRGHLELLVKEGLAREVEVATGRERRFLTSLSNIVVTLEGYHRRPVPKGVEPPRQVVRLQRKLEAIQKDVAKLQEKARQTAEEIADEWAKHLPAPGA